MRLSVAALHCLFSLAALGCKTCVASGVPTRAADGEGDFAGIADEHVRTNPNSAARASVAVEADGSLLVRQPVHPHEMSSSEGDGEWHHGTVHDDDRVQMEEHVRTDPHASARASVTVEADGSMLVLHEKMTHSENLVAGALVEDGVVGESEHAKFDSDVVAEQVLTLPDVFAQRPWETWGAKVGLNPTASSMIFYASLVVLIVIMIMCCCRCLGSRPQQRSDPVQPAPIVVILNQPPSPTASPKVPADVPAKDGNPTASQAQPPSPTASPKVSKASANQQALACQRARAQRASASAAVPAKAPAVKVPAKAAAVESKPDRTIPASDFSARFNEGDPKLGMKLMMADDGVTWRAQLKEGSCLAFERGIRPGDKVMEVNGHTTAGLTKEEARRLFKCRPLNVRVSRQEESESESENEDKTVVDLTGHRSTKGNHKFIFYNDDSDESEYEHTAKNRGTVSAEDMAVWRIG